MRNLLPPRRFAETYSLEWGGFNKGFTVTLGLYHNLSIGEVFITGGKSGEQVEASARDGAVLISLALQHGASIETIAHAITRDGHGEPQTIIGAVIDFMRQRNKVLGITP